MNHKIPYFIWGKRITDNNNSYLGNELTGVMYTSEFLFYTSLVYPNCLFLAVYGVMYSVSIRLL